MIHDEDSLASHIDRILLQNGDRSLITYLDRNGHAAQSLTGTALREQAFSSAAALKANVAPGSSVLLVMPPGPEFLISLLGCFYAGIIAIPLPEPDLDIHKQRLEAVLFDSNAAAVLQHSQKLTLQARKSSRKPAALPREIAIVQYTSGSTRHPRGVALSGQNVLSNARLIGGRWRMNGSTDVMVNWLPHYHDMGLLGGLLNPLLLAGRSVQLSPRTFLQHPIRWLRAIADHRGTVSGGPAFAFGLCLENIADKDLAGLDLSSWKVAFCGAEPVPSRLLCRFRERFQSTGIDPAAVHACYGLAEATLFVAGERKWDSEAAPIPSTETTLEPCCLPDSRVGMLIVDPETCRPLQDGQIGEIWVTGPSVALGYISPSGRVDSGGGHFSARIPGSPERYLRTGDLGWIGPEGLFISGRLKDILISNGVNIAAVDIEWLAAGYHPSLNPLAAAAVPVLSENVPETASLLIEVKPFSPRIDHPTDVAERIRRGIRASHGIDLRCIRFVRKGSLERTTSGKIRRHTVAERLRSGHLYPEPV